MSDCASSDHPEGAGAMGTDITQHASDEAVPIVPQSGCVVTNSCSGRVADDSAYYITDANVGILGGEISMDGTGNLGLSPDGGWLLEAGHHIDGIHMPLAIHLRIGGYNMHFAHSTEKFEKVHRRWITNLSQEKIGEVFSLRSTTNTQLYLALNVRSPKYCVRGMVSKSLYSTASDIIFFIYRRWRPWEVPLTAIGQIFHSKILPNIAHPSQVTLLCSTEATILAPQILMTTSLS